MHNKNITNAGHSHDEIFLQGKKKKGGQKDITLRFLPTETLTS